MMREHVCKSANDAFESAEAHARRVHTIQSVNFADDAFFNGTLDDSPYDLLLDIELISEVLFEIQSCSRDSQFSLPEVVISQPQGARSSPAPADQATVWFPSADL